MAMADDLIIYTPMYVTFFWGMVLLLTRPSENRARHFLGYFMLAAFLLYLSHAVYFKKEYMTYQYFDTVYMFASLSVFPLYYWYIKRLTVEASLQWKNLVLLLPALLLAAINFILYRLMKDPERMYYLSKLFSDPVSYQPDSLVVKMQKWTFIISRLVFFFQVIYFVLRGRKLVIKYHEVISNFYSSIENRKIVWVKLLLYSFVIISITSLVFNLIGRSLFLNSPALLMIPSLIFSVLLFVIGMQGFMQNHTVAEMNRDQQKEPVLLKQSINRELLRSNLMELFEEKKIFRQSDLKITEVSQLLSTNRTYVSEMINKDYACSFNDFVNSYRLKEAEKLLSDQGSRNYSLDWISEMAGFGSLNTFIRVFKAAYGKTPGRYRDEMNSRKFQMNTVSMGH